MTAILAALASHGQRLRAQGIIPPIGYGREPIDYVLDLDPDGGLLAVTNLRAGKRNRGPVQSVPLAAGATSNIKASLLWGSKEYTLGLPRDGAVWSNPKLPLYLQSFIARLDALPAAVQQDAGVQAVRRFLARHVPAEARSGPLASLLVDADPMWVSFRLQDDADLVCQRPAVADYLAAQELAINEDQFAGRCLLTGVDTTAARLHTKIKLRGVGMGGAPIVNFNAPSSRFNNLLKGQNAPISVRVVGDYSSALNHLLSSRDEHVSLGDVTLVYWTAEPGLAGRFIAPVLGLEPLTSGAPDADEADDSAPIEDVATPLKMAFRAPWRGDPVPVPEAPFYLLGLAPNSGRISIVSWYEGTLAEVVQALQRWYDALRNPASRFGDGVPSLPRIVKALAPLKKTERVSTLTVASLFMVAIGQSPLPRNFVATALQQLRNEEERGWRYTLISILRLGLIYHCQKEVPLSLDLDNTDPAYLLGRLFAVYHRTRLEFDKTRADSPLEVNYDYAMRNQQQVQQRPTYLLINLRRLWKAHHDRIRRDLNPGTAYWLRGWVAEIDSKLPPPSVLRHPLTMEQRAQFEIGSSHQMTAMFTPREKPGETAADTPEALTA